MKGRLVVCWHDDSPGSKVTVWRPWWKTKMRPFATLGETIRATRPILNATKDCKCPNPRCQSWGCAKHD